ncbi:MAG: O-antigen ligase family protein [Eubacterium sp.]|nr:O-antigen ligase family protein [Eubacterium sp.]
MKQKNVKYNNKSKMMNNAVQEEVVVNTVKSLPRWVFIPIAVILVVIPLITIIHHFDCGLENYEWFSLDGSIDDFFLYYKSFFLRIVGALILVILALVVPFYDHSFLKEKRNISPVVAMGIFGLITLVSSFLSEHMSDAFLGGVEEFEGCFILLTYVGSFYLAFGYIKTIKVIKFILDAVMIGGFLIGLLGFLQTLGFDWMSTDLAKYLVTAEIRDQIDYDSFQIGSIFTDNTAYATLYNPNYMGSYVTVVLPYTAYLTIFGDKLYRKIFALITSVMLIISLYSSHSLTGMLSVVFAVAVLVVLIIPLLKKKGRVITLSIVGVLIAGAMVVMVSSGFMDKLFASPEQSKGVQSIDNMKNHKDHIDVFLMDGRKMVVNLNKDALTDPLWALNSSVDKLITLTDDKGENISYEVDGNGHAKINQDGYPGFEFYTDVVTDVMVEQTEENNYGYVSLLYILDPEAEGTFRFKYTGEKIMHLNDFDRTDNIYYIDKWGFRNNDDFASGRGYIWARTFPLLVRCMLTGYGPDNFVYYYPNFDYVGKGYGAYKNMTTSKPHNMYMQIWVQDGFLVVAAMVFLYVLFMIRVFRLCYGKNRLKLEKGTTPFGVVLATATAASGFMFVGIANDSLVGITSIYWCMLGVGYAAESMCHKQQKELIENA